MPAWACQLPASAYATTLDTRTGQPASHEGALDTPAPRRRCSLAYAHAHSGQHAPPPLSLSAALLSRRPLATIAGAERMPPDDTRSRLERMQAAFGCDPAAAEALAQEHPVLLLLGPYALRRLASPSLEQGFSAGPFAKAGGVATSRLLSEVAVDAPCTLQMRAMHWGEHAGLVRALVRVRSHPHQPGLALS
jgi:hypothetical protein